MPPLDQPPLDPEAVPLLERALGRWQQRRAAVYCIVATAIFPLVTFDELKRLVLGGRLVASDYTSLVLAYGLAGGFAFAAVVFWRMAPQPKRIARRFGWVLMTAGIACIFASMLVLVFDPEVYTNDFTPEIRTIAYSLTALLLVFVVHFIGSLFVALPPWPALWPLIPLWIMFAASVAGLEGSRLFRATLVAVFPLAGIPGLVWSVWRHERWVDRFTLRFVGGRWNEMRRDLSEARRVHESIFPAPIDEERLAVRYVYEPRRDIGGDFLLVRRLAPEQVLVVVVDVTGHGVASALAVTRIHAVLEFMAVQGAQAGAPIPSPGDLLARLNAFLYETLAPQGVFATAIAILADFGHDALRWASAGHPTGVLRRIDGSIVELESTCPMLGVLAGDLFAADERTVGFAPGEAVLLCTDGLLEAEGEGRVPFGFEGMLRAVRTHRTRLAAEAMRAVHAHRVGPASDDTLVVEIVRGEGKGTPIPPGAAAAAIHATERSD
ncbi:MAG: serine/threonine-protein phosphatase [Phycisphaerales bacterium]|nr:serine/threonine-protein phosphatase [Phycisphaerales bacterium]